VPTLFWLSAQVLTRRSRHATHRHPASRPSTSDRGEGVISAAIAVLVIASVGALMWFGFQRMWERTETKTNEQIEQIGA